MTRQQPRRVGASVVINVGIIIIGLIAIVGLLVMQLVADEEAIPDGRMDLALHLEPVAEGLREPVLLVGAGDGSGERYIVEQGGTVMRLRADGTLESTPFLDIRDRVLHHHERGLLGLAFHPDHAQNGRLFALYSRAPDGATAISEFVLPVADTGDGLDAGSDQLEDTERALLVIPQFSTMHKGGMLAFDLDGMLLAGIGDGSTGNDPDGNALDRASLLGKLLRFDVDRGYPYAIPADNGFADDRSARPEVHAIGLRNPWRFSVDREGGEVYIGDVGQSDWEEIDVLARDAREPSFGWADMEGHECFFGRPCDPAAHIPPVVAYPHKEGDIGHCGVIGGHVYRGEAGSLPAGTYLYADYCSGTIWAVSAAQLRADRAEPAAVGRVPTELGRVVSFGEDDDGEVYLLTDDGWVLAVSQAASAEPA